MFEHRRQKLIPVHKFIKRLVWNLILGLGILFLSLIGGIAGYHYVEGMPWIDAYVNASMILSGMGPIGELKTFGGKMFAGSYALFSGIVFLISIAVILAPVFHRYMHKFHLQDK